MTGGAAAVGIRKLPDWANSDTLPGGWIHRRLFSMTREAVLAIEHCFAGAALREALLGFVICEWEFPSALFTFLIGVRDGTGGTPHHTFIGGSVGERSHCSTYDTVIVGGGHGAFSTLFDTRMRQVVSIGCVSLARHAVVILVWRMAGIALRHTRMRSVISVSTHVTCLTIFLVIWSLPTRALLDTRMRRVVSVWRVSGAGFTVVICVGCMTIKALGHALMTAMICVGSVASTSLAVLLVVGCLPCRTLRHTGV